LVAFLEAFDQLFNSLRLVAGGAVFRVKFEDILFVLHKSHLIDS
jgi:hypothetical protein